MSIPFGRLKEIEQGDHRMAQQPNRLKLYLYSSLKANDRSFFSPMRRDLRPRLP